MDIIRQWSNKIFFSWVKNAQKWLGLRKFIVRIPAYYLPTMAHQNYFLLVQRCFKIVGPPLAHYWHANLLFSNSFHNLTTMTQPSVLLESSLFTDQLHPPFCFKIAVILKKIKFLSNQMYSSYQSLNLVYSSSWFCLKMAVS